MKSVVIILASILFFSALYAAYVRFIPAPAQVEGAGPTTPIALPTPSPDPNVPMPAGQGTWGNLYDKNQVLYTRFRSTDYQHQPDGTYHLNHPEAEFYEPSGQVIHLTADSGDIRVDQNAQRMELSGVAPTMPREGTLQDVHVGIYPSKAAYDSDPGKPDVTVSLPRMRFNSDTFQMLSAEYTDPATGREVPADQVPVTVRGNVEFDGTGMVMYWNEVTHELKSLTIAHGRRMLIKQTPAKPAAGGLQPTVPPPQGAPSEPPVKDQTPMPPGVQAGDEGPVSSPDAPVKTVFQATFAGNVLVKSTDNRIWADDMYVDFLMGSGNGTPAPPAAPEPAPAAAGTPAPAQTGTPAPDAAPSHDAAGKSDLDMQGPVEVTWDGPLHIAPAPEPAPKLVRDQHIIRFTGSPVRIHSDDGDATGDVVQYNTADGVAHLRGTPERPLVIIRNAAGHGGQAAAQPVHVTAQNLRFSQATDVALFTGSGQALFPDPAHPGTLLKTSWDKTCTIRLTPAHGPNEKPSLQQVDLDGNATILQGLGHNEEITDQRLNLRGNHITIEFQPKSMQAGTVDQAADLKSLVATGDVHCVVRDAKGAERTIDTDKLTVTTAHDPTGKIYPQYVIAEGNVHAVEEDQNLHSDRMDVTLAPSDHSKHQADDSATGDVQLVRLLATGNVVAHGKNGSSAVGDSLQVEQINGHPLVTMVGNPPALINDGGGSLRGNEIEVRPDDDWAMVPGPGSIDAAEASAKTGIVQPMHISWDDSAELRGPDNLADIRGHVLATTTDERGSVDTATADRAILTLGPKPTTEPTDDSKSDTGGDMHFLKGKEVKQVTLLDHAEVNSVLNAPDGTLIRRAHIFGQHIDYFIPEKRLVVPVPGRMLIEDHTPAPAKAGGESGAGSPAGARGATAFEWEKSFTFDEMAQQATFDSPVTIVHQSDDPHSDPVHLIADHVVADFQPVAPPAGDSVDPNSASAPMALKMVTATGHVRIQSRDTEMDASEAKFDPIAEILTLKGKPGDPVTVTDSNHQGGENYGEVEFNTRTGQIKTMVDFNGRIRG